MQRFSALAPLDKYGVSPSINWKGRPKTFSLCGIFATFLILVCVVIFAVLFSSDMVHKTNPTQTQSILYGGLNKETRLIEDDIFTTAFGVMDSENYTYYQDPTIYSVTANLIVTDPNLGEVSTPIDLESCSNDPDDAMYQGYCFAKTQSRLSGIYLGKDNIARVEISFDRCSAETVGVTCAADAETEDKLFNSIWTTMYSVWSIDPSNYEEPVSQDINDEWYDIPDTGKTKKLSVNLMAIEFNSDNGWAIKSNKIQKAVTYESSQIDFIDPGYGNTFFFLTLRMSGNKASYSRTYQKIQSVLAQISGTMGLVTIVIGLVAVPYAQSNMHELLINEAYKIVEKEKASKSPKRRRKVKQNMMKRIQDNSNKLEEKPASNPKRPQEIQLIKISEAGKKASEAKYESPVSRNFDGIDTYGNLDSSPSRFLEDYSAIRVSPNSRVKSALLGPKVEASPSNLYLAHKGDADPTGPMDFKSSKFEENIIDQPNSEIRLETIGEEKAIMNPTEKIELNTKDDLEEDDQEANESKKGTTTPIVRHKPESTTFKEWFISNFKPSGRSKALNRGKSEVLQHVDVFSIIRRFQEIDNLKACLLNEHQRVLFDNIAKPSLVINSHLSTKDPNFITVEGWDESYRGDKNRLCEAYKKVVSQAGRTELDRQVLELFENGLDDDEFEEMGSLL